MVHSMGADRGIVNRMGQFWKLGSDAASKMHLHAEAQLHYSKESEIYYVLEVLDVEKSGFALEVILFAGRSFPERSGSILLAIEELIKQIPKDLKGDRLEWLQRRTELEYLKRAQASISSHSNENMGFWLQHQALVLGSYYGLMQQLLCAEFANIIRTEGKISQSHVLYMLSTMYSGQQKSFASLSTGQGLIGIVSSISVLSRPLLLTTDNPEEIMLVDLPILDLTPHLDGELFACAGGGIIFDQSPVSFGAIRARSPSNAWSIHAKMGLLFEDGMSGVVMAARCGGRLAGWFNPLAADVAFLGTAYQRKRQDAEVSDCPDQFTFSGFEIEDSHYQEGHLPRPITDDPKKLISMVQSRNCPGLKYAAAGMFTEVGEEVATVTDDIEAGYGRVEGQGEGIIIA